MTRPRFHLAFPVHDLALAREFYGGVLGCAEGRCSSQWIDFDFQGHQIVAHLSPEECALTKTSSVDGKNVPVRHFGLILDWDEFDALKTRLIEADFSFLVAPYLRFKDKPGEQKTLFVADPSGNALEFKAFRNDNMVFSTSLEG